MRSTTASCAVIVMLSFCGISLTHAQAPAIQWERSFGGSGLDDANSILQTPDGGYIVAGYNTSNDGDVTGNHGGKDYWVMKLTSAGSIEWQKSLGGSGDDEARAIQQTSDGGFVVTGHCSSTDGDVTGNHGSYDYWVVKLSDTGKIEWEKSLGGSGDDEARSIHQTKDGGYIVAGFSNSNDGNVTGNHGGYDYWIVKLTSAGSIEWEKSFGGSSEDEAFGILQTIDDGYITSGYTYSTDGDVKQHLGGQDYWVLKLSNTGAIQWQRTLGGSGDDWSDCLLQKRDGGYVIGGKTTSNDGDVSGNHGAWDFWAVSLSDTGSIQWQKVSGGGDWDRAEAVVQTSDGGFIMPGYSLSNDGGEVTGHHGSSDCWVIKLSADGKLQWEKSLGGSGNDYENSVAQTMDGGYILAGVSNSTDGDVTGNHGSYDFWIVKLAPDNADVSPTSEQPASISINPNPFLFSTRVTALTAKHVRVCNELGIEVAMLSEPTQGEFVWIPDTNIPAGTYFVVSDDQSVKVEPLTLLR